MRKHDRHTIADTFLKQVIHWRGVLTSHLRMPNRTESGSDRPNGMAKDFPRPSLPLGVLLGSLSAGQPAVSSDDVESLVSRIVEGLVFLRLCEERGLEPSEQLGVLSNQNDIY